MGNVDTFPDYFSYGDEIVYINENGTHRYGTFRSSDFWGNLVICYSTGATENIPPEMVQRWVAPPKGIPDDE